MRASAVVMSAPGDIAVEEVVLAEPTSESVIVEVAASGISTGTEKLLWQGRMPAFPGLGYPLVPGYEAIGRIVEAGPASGRRIGEAVFVPGSAGFSGVKALFGGAARTIVTPASRVVANDIAAAPAGLCLALAATAHHAVAGGRPPELIVGHGVVGWLLARITIARGAPPPVVWEIDPVRRAGGDGYAVIAPGDDTRRDYAAVIDASGDVAALDDIIARLAHGGEIALAGFYATPVSFAFPPAFVREARLRIAAEWRPEDMAAVVALIDAGRLSLDGLVTDAMPAVDASAAYARAFSAPECLKMMLEWN